MNGPCKFCLASEAYEHYDGCEFCLLYIERLYDDGSDGATYARQLTNQANRRRVERMAG